MPNPFKTSTLLLIALIFFLHATPVFADHCGGNSIHTGLGICVDSDPASLVNAVLQIAIGVAGGVAFLMLAYGGFRMIFSQGSPDAIQDAREIITGAIIGLLVVIFSVFFLRLIGINVLGLPI